MTGILILEDGTIYRGKGFGAAATNVGELVFNTLMTGYQELLTDPAVTGQVINMTYPLLGNYGVSEIDNQSENIRAFGLIARDITFRPSNRWSVMSISEWFTQQGVPGIYNVDTRAITKKIRTQGTCKCVISTEGISKDHALELLGSTVLRTDSMKNAGVELRVTRRGSAAEGKPGRGLKIIALDFGIKRSAVTELTGRGCDVILCPYDTTAHEVLAMNPDGLFLSDGPGDPEKCELGIKTVSELIGRVPVFGSGIGHLVIALAAGGKTYKLKYGHRGGNHGVIDLETGRSAITNQNHGFAVEPESLSGSGLIVSHVNLNDGTVEGMRHEKLPVFSSAFSPEGGPGSNDPVALYDSFVEMMIKVKAGSQKGDNAHA